MVHEILTFNAARQDVKPSHFDCRIEMLIAQRLLTHILKNSQNSRRDSDINYIPVALGWAVSAITVVQMSNQHTTKLLKTLDPCKLKAPAQAHKEISVPTLKPMRNEQLRRNTAPYRGWESWHRLRTIPASQYNYWAKPTSTGCWVMNVLKKMNARQNSKTS